MELDYAAHPTSIIQSIRLSLVVGITDSYAVLAEQIGAVGLRRYHPGVILDEQRFNANMSIKRFSETCSQATHRVKYE